jgi:hypothetical protein
VRSKTKDGGVGEIWWTGPRQALVCVTDGCWESAAFFRRSLGYR